MNSTTKPYNPTEGKKEQVQRMFDAIAWRYDLLNHTLSLGIDRSWRKRLVRAVAQSGATHILDMATGTADLALMLARQLPHATIEGVDLSAQMLLHGAAKVQAAGVSDRVHLTQGDAELLPFADATFDAVTVAFGVRNFEALNEGMSELLRVLKPGGTLYVLEFGSPRHKLFGTIYRLYFHHILPTIGKLLSKDKHAYSYLPQSVDTFPYGEPFATLLLEVGFSDCHIHHLLDGVAQLYIAPKKNY